MTRGGSKTVATSKEELLVIIVNGLKPLAIITKSSSLDVAAVLDPPLVTTVVGSEIGLMDHDIFVLSGLISLFM